jgi:pyroglutamyl-peptidase
MAAENRRILLAGFEPFGGRLRNQSWQVVRRFGARYGIDPVELPVDFARLKELVPRLAADGPRAVLLVGEAARDDVAVEQVALNIADSERPDGAGRKPQAETIVAGAPLALRASWDARVVAAALRQRGVPARASFHAGTYACNTTLYLALHALSDRARIGFLHVPRRRWPLGPRLGLLVRAVEIAADEILKPTEGSRSTR